MGRPHRLPIPFGAGGKLEINPMRLTEGVTAWILVASGGKGRNTGPGASMWLAGGIGLACGSG
ncbi:hypothetical protein [Roseovarius sp. M141]|uniref:hypothetical protein n=1 Tax=Roseovarius sp. M141 TaxID=2583806 RepID=UPI0020CFA493|nr:hypothetical protein [Roseovarius sp. M141]MCQ0091059.1 hypothetical protein [Roseovarius sp. M141]